MPDVPEIALTQLLLWYDPTRIQTWPAFLSAIPGDFVAETPTDFGRLFASDRMTSDRHSYAFNLVRNMPGLERRGGQLQLRGVGLLDRTKSGYRLSSSAAELVATYRQDPDGAQWVCLLADALLGREPRTRAFVRLLSEAGAYLEFEREGWFEGSYRKSRIVRPGCPDLHPFDDSESMSLQGMLRDAAWWCLGDWRSHPFLEGATACVLRGQRSSTPSLRDIGLALRSALEVLLVVGIVRSDQCRVFVNASVAAANLPHRIEEYSWKPAAPQRDLISDLAELLPTLESPTGHVVASELREALRLRGIADPDRAIAREEQEGRLSVFAEDYGQARHGRGLYDDPRKQLVKIRLVHQGASS